MLSCAGAAERALEEGVMPTRKREQSRGPGGMLPRENLKLSLLKRLEMHLKLPTVMFNFKLSNPLKTTSHNYIYNLERTVYRNLNE